jgi:hypothetical protein
MGSYGAGPSHYMWVDNTDAVTGTGTRWPSANGLGTVVASASAATSEVATAAMTAIESITLLIVPATAQTISILNHAGSALVPGGLITLPAAADIVCPHTVKFGESGLPINGGFSIDVSDATASFMVFYRRVA